MNLKNPKALDEVKNKLMDEPEIIDRLPDSKTYYQRSRYFDLGALFFCFSLVNK
ncbi:hypothetical protein [Psychrobacter sp. P11G5]|uniref:hypothetical protein n=1 Tax=Psychrobacter sp. P11G5 TaxID=1699624 RepID=UPI000AD1E1B3|nr:hypothetical protein [Psychrobacter sp. P11G5]